MSETTIDDSLTDLIQITRTEKKTQITAVSVEFFAVLQFPFANGPSTRGKDADGKE
jgi:hypothetical protein